MKRVALLILISVFLTNCRGMPSREPPIHLNPNMDQQARLNPQEPFDFFEDGRAMRPQVPGTVPRGYLKDNDHLHRGKVGGKIGDKGGSDYAKTLPMPLTSSLLKHGQKRFNIYCAVCHDEAGTGNGIVIQRGMVPPPSFHDPRLRAMPVGQIFETMTQGIRNMPAYEKQIPVEDRWAIAAYVRALQLSQNASINLVPADEAAAKRWTK